MKQINNGFADYYYITEDGKIYNSKIKEFCFQNKTKFNLITEDGKRKAVNLKSIYKLVYGKNFCIDNIENLKNEQWKYIDNTEESYMISTYGRVKSLKGYKARILKVRLVQNTYYRVDIQINNNKRSKLIHKLVAEAFLTNDKGTDVEIHHKDFNPLNNHVDNLQYLTYEEHHRVHNEQRKPPKDTKKDNPSL